MDSKPCNVCIFSLYLILHFLSPSSHASREMVCNSTPFPFFCKSLLPQNQTATIHDYGRFSVHHSLATTRNFLSLVNGYLKFQFVLPKTTIQALQDCQFLLGLNLEFLSTTIPKVDSKNTLYGSQAEDVQTLLSAILTNQQTCLDGLEAINSASSVTNALLVPLFNGSMLYSVSLALFRHGWVHDTEKTRWLSEREHVFSEIDSGRSATHLPLKMSRHDQNVSESISGRKLLQTIGNNNVLVNQTVFVNPNGSGNFSNINDAVAAAPDNADPRNGYFLIYVVEGVYEEYVLIPRNKQYLMMIGAGINRTIITGNHSVVDGSTFNCSTFAVVGQGFVAVNITFRNTAGPNKYQAVALRNGADLSTFYSCSFEGYQDTLYAHSLRQLYKDCDIYGTVDFMFGNAVAILQNCNIYARLPMQGQFNAITAQGRTDINQNTGISIQNCKISATNDLASITSNGTIIRTFLGRPWKVYSRTVYIKSFMDSLIDPSGWTEWSGDFALNTSYYGEFDNWGPGSRTANRVTWPSFHVMNKTDAANFTVSNFIMGDNWLPVTGVPYIGGLQ